MGLLSLSHFVRMLGRDGCHADRRVSRQKNKHTEKQVNATHHDLTTSRLLIVLRHSGRRSPDTSDKRTGAAAQPSRFHNKQTESKFRGTSETPAHAAFGSLLLFHVNSFEESFFPSTEFVHVHAHLAAGSRQLRLPYPSLPPPSSLAPA